MTRPAPSRERDQPAIQAAIDEVFGASLPTAAAYADLLCGIGVDRGMIGPREADRIWERHLLNSAVLAALVPVGARVIDLGSGAGLPGIPLAIARPDVTVVLLEPMQRRVRFLEECLEVLRLSRVSIQHGRAEAGVDELADVVVARAVASLVELVRLSFGLLVDNGTLLALKGKSATGEVEQVRQTMAVDAEILSLPAPGQPATVVRVARPARGAGERRRPAERRSR